MISLRSVVANLKMRKNKSKEEIKDDLKKIEEVKHQKALAEASILPAFTKHNVTVYQAGQVLEVLKQVSMGKMNQHWAERPFGELGMAEELTKDGEVTDKDMYGEIIESLKDVPVAKAMKLFDVFTRVIEMYGHKQVMQVKITELPFEEILGIK